MRRGSRSSCSNPCIGEGSASSLSSRVGALAATPPPLRLGDATRRVSVPGLAVTPSFPWILEGSGRGIGPFCVCLLVTNSASFLSRGSGLFSRSRQYSGFGFLEDTAFVWAFSYAICCFFSCDSIVCIFASICLAIVFCNGGVLGSEISASYRFRADSTFDAIFSNSRVGKNTGLVFIVERRQPCRQTSETDDRSACGPYRVQMVVARPGCSQMHRCRQR